MAGGPPWLALPRSGDELVLSEAGPSQPQHSGRKLGGENVCP